MLTALIFILALALRLTLSPLAFHVDILSFAGWGQWIYLHGPMGFYENSTWIYSWPTQPPFVNLIYGFDNWLYVFLLQMFRDIANIIVRFHLAPGHMIWWFSFTKWFDTAKVSGESVFTIGYLSTIKMLPALADLGIAGLIYWITKTSKKVKRPPLWAAVYLFSPFAFYLSSLWGQYDQFAFLPVFLALILEANKKVPVITPFLFALGIAIKPTSILILPFFIYIYFKNYHKKTEIIISLVLIAVLYFITTKVFTNQDIYTFSSTTLYDKIFLKSASRLSTNSFNFWRIFQKTGGEPSDFRFLFIPANIWSVVAFIILNIIAFKKAATITIKNVFSGAFIVSAGSWLFMTNMLERYFFAGIVTGLVVTIFNPKAFKYWLILSLIFVINLYSGWWFPEFLTPLRLALIWQGGILTKFLALTNIFLFLKITLIMVK